MAAPLTFLVEVETAKEPSHQGPASRKSVMMRVRFSSLTLLLLGCWAASAQEGDLAEVSGLACPSDGYMWPDAQNLCFVWFCERAGEPPIKRACPKGSRVPTWWDGGFLNMCFEVNIEEHGGQNICLRCDVSDPRIDDSCASGRNPCPDECDCIDIEYTHRCDCPIELGVGGGVFVPNPEDFCESNPCQNGGTCQNQWDDYFCFCDAQWTGHSCELGICEWDPCMNGGTCVVDDVGYHCVCADCWTGACCNETSSDEICGVTCGPCRTGSDCATEIDSCECRDCGVGSSCVELEGGTTCVPILCDTCTVFEDGECQAVTGLCDCNNPCPAGQTCQDGDELRGQVTCKEGNPSSGTDFTVMFEENDTEQSIPDIPLELYVTPATPNSGTRSVNIRSAALQPGDACYFNTNETVPENAVLRFPVARCMRHDGTGLKNLGIKVTEVNGRLIMVYGINKDRYTADGFLATPDSAAGTSFQTASYAPAHISTQFGIVAMSDDTRVRIELADDNDLPAPYNRKGAVYELVMGAYQTFQVQATCADDGTAPGLRQCSKDLSGSLVTADKPIHVHSGNVRAFIIAGQARSRDHLVEELIPTDRWGMQFGFESVPGRTVGDLLNIMALKGEATTVQIYQISGGSGETVQSFSLPQDGRLNVYREIPSGGQFYVVSDRPISVTLLTKSRSRGEDFHDPASITIPPTAQFTNNFFISTPLFSGGNNFQPKPYNTNMALLVARAGDEPYITVDGEPLSDFITSWSPLPGDGGLVGCTVRLRHGTSLVRSSANRNFQCLVYGYDDRETYGFPAAMNHKVINPL